MQTFLSILRTPLPFPPRRGAVSAAAKLAVCAALAATADFLFYGEPAGWTVALFAALILLALRAVTPGVVATPAGKAIAVLLCGLLLPLAAHPGTLPVCVFAGGFLLLLTLARRRGPPDAALWCKDILRFALRAPVQWMRDRGMLKRATAKGKTAPSRGHALRLLPPLVLTAVFCALFIEANPVIARIAAMADWARHLGGLLSPLRWLFWAAVAALLWAALRPRTPPGGRVAFSLGQFNLDRWLDRRSLVWSLVVFNLLFAAQNALDIAFLWNGQGKLLPEGMTLARYAHAGAYPLVITALLAGAYVLVAFDDSRARDQSHAARALVAAWVAQNVFLVVSSIDRTLLYVEFYSLTYLRVAALVWMGLVALGLCLVIARIFLKKTNAWLVNMNALALAGVLYACCFANFDRLIADYNVRHAQEVMGKGAGLDMPYLRDIGPEALAALRWFEQNAAVRQFEARFFADTVEADFRAGYAANWRSWTWRRQYIFDHHLTPP